MEDLQAAQPRTSTAIVGIVFSKDRALQLDGLLRSYALHCSDPGAVELHVLYAASSPEHARRYELVQRRHPGVNLVPEVHFKKQLATLALAAELVLFLVDDTLFCRGFSPCAAAELLRTQPEALGYSFRLGRNTLSCYTLGIPQALPESRQVEAALSFRWVGAEGDFGYPLEVSSSLYRTADLRDLLLRGPYTNPNTLEAWLSERLDTVAYKPLLLCPLVSAAFSNPVNKVQAVFGNRVTELAGHTAQDLAEAFDQGLAIAVSAFSGLVPEGAHHAAQLPLEPARAMAAPAFTPPRISVVIPCYNQGHLLAESLGSLVAQTSAPLEAVVVDDGSTDGSGDVARALARGITAFAVRVVSTPNAGLPSARNLGIRLAQGDWVFPLDADDILGPDFFSRAVEVLRRNPGTNLVFANVDFFGARTEGWIPEEYSVAKIATQDTFPYASLFPRRLWELAGGYDPGLPWGAEDWNFWITCSELGLRPQRIPDKIFHYRTHLGGMYARMMEHWEEMLALLRTLHPHRHPLRAVLAAHRAVSAMCVETHARIDALVQRFPQRPMPRFWLGLRVAALGEDLLAEEHLRLALSTSPPWEWQAAWSLGQLLRRTGRTAEAEVLLARARAVQPGLAVDTTE